MKLSKEYFENKIEQAKIEGALLQAIPPDVKYYNLIIVLSKMLSDYSRLAFKEEVMTEPTETK